MRRRRALVTLLGLAIAAGLLVGGVVAYFAVLRQPAPWSSGCTATTAAGSVRITPVQARNAALIASVAAQRGLDERAVTIALATAWQESGLRNLDHGDRDSLGLFQQRPSQGWGSEAQIMDPLYSAGAFYAAMVKVKGWQSADVGDVAQAVQRSGFPDAYDKHVANARILAGALMGEPAGFTCAVRDAAAPDPAGLAALLDRALPGIETVSVQGSRVTVRTADAAAARRVAAFAVAHASAYGATQVQADGRTWGASWPVSSGWRTGGAATGGDVVIRVG